MKYPSFGEIGIDEVGRGSLAGPVVACAIMIPNLKISNIKDSKQLNHHQREEIYELLKRDPNVKWGIGRVSEKMIDKINILQATKLAMKKAVSNLDKNIKHSVFDKSTFLLIDGNFGIDLNIKQKSIIKGDQKILSIAAASIVAKVHRDRLMTKFHLKYPEYGFDKHKGYGTEEHRNAIKKSGFCKIHRKTFHIS